MVWDSILGEETSQYGDISGHDCHLLSSGARSPSFKYKVYHKLVLVMRSGATETHCASVDSVVEVIGLAGKTEVTFEKCLHSVECINSLKYNRCVSQVDIEQSSWWLCGQNKDGVKHTVATQRFGHWIHKCINSKSFIKSDYSYFSEMGCSRLQFSILWIALL